MPTPENIIVDSLARDNWLAESDVQRLLGFGLPVIKMLNQQTRHYSHEVQAMQDRSRKAWKCKDSIQIHGRYVRWFTMVIARHIQPLPRDTESGFMTASNSDRLG